MDEQKREILAKVADGSLSPEDAAVKLEELERAAGPVATAVNLGEAPPAAGPIRRVRVIASMGNAVITGDPTVKEAVAEGRHQAHQEGDTLVIQAGTEEHGFRFHHRGNAVWIGADAPTTIKVRINPALDLEVEANAASVRARDLKGAVRAQVKAGSIVIDGFDGPLNVQCQAGSFRGRGRIVGGQSEIHCEAGSARLSLTPDSSLTIKARATMGSVRVEGAKVKEDATEGFLGERRVEAVVGGGAGTIDIDASMGSVKVSVE
jgi:hypothetical protein